MKIEFLYRPFGHAKTSDSRRESQRHLLWAALVLAVTAAPANATLLARWHFDETNGGVAHDKASGFDGTLEGGATFDTEEGIICGAVSVGSTGTSHVLVGDRFQFTGTETFSIQAWVKSRLTVGQPSIVVGRRHVALGDSFGYGLELNDWYETPPDEPVGSFHLFQSFDQSVSEEQINSGASNVDNGDWHQIVAVRDGAAGKVRLYVDGHRAPMSTSEGPIESIIATEAPFVIGGFQLFQLVGNLFQGLIDEVRVWDHALSDAEVLDLYDSPGNCERLCGDGNSSQDISASDALFVLRTAVGTAECLFCICDADNSGSIVASDALQTLRKSVGQGVAMMCPACEP